MKKLLPLSFISLLLVSCGQGASPDASSFSSSSNSESICYHFYEEQVKKEPTLLESGLKELVCKYCGDKKEEAIFKLDEFVFEDCFYQYDGNEHDAVIKGLLPLGTTVEYQNNGLKEKGSKEVTANIYDENHKLLISKKAQLTITDNTGFANVYIDTNNVEIADKENYVSMTLKTDNCQDKYILNNVTGGIRLRGNGTLTYDKKAFRLKLDSKTNLLGLNGNLKAKSWVLIADYADQSMMRNETAFYMGNSLLNYSKKTV